MNRPWAGSFTSEEEKAIHRTTHTISPVPALLSNGGNVLRMTDPLIIKAVRVLFTRRRCVTTESYISDFSHSSSPLLVKPPYLCVERFSVYSKLSAEGAEGMQMLESMFTG